MKWSSLWTDSFISDADISHKIIIRLEKYKLYFGSLDIIEPCPSYWESEFLPSVMSEAAVIVIVTWASCEVLPFGGSNLD